jgi:aminoglycoside phosphotransferase (APT) family kinase protein
VSGHARLHEDEIPIDDSLARQLVETQFPQWRGLPVRRIHSSGTVNAIFRVGRDLAIRLPRAPSFVHTREAMEASHAWLDWARPTVPLAIPEPVAIGEPTEAYPWPWPVHRWIDGEPLGTIDLSDAPDAAERLGAFVNALHSLAVPDSGAPRSVKAIGREAWDPFFREVLDGLNGIVDRSSVLAAWEETMQAPAWDAPYVWIHGDLLPDNLLARSRILAAVIDFECYGTGDPALDLAPAWSVFSYEAAAVFRNVVAADDATWQRARNHALRAVNGIRYYERTNPGFSAMCQRTVERAVADRGR